MSLLVLDQRAWSVPRRHVALRVDDHQRASVMSRTLAAINLRTARITENLYSAVGRRIR